MPSRQVIVVAHPDDECIFAGGAAIRAGCDIICCSIPRRDPIRVLKFYDACEALGCRGIVLPYQEKPPESLDLQYLDLNHYKSILTHNKMGEYGHAHHKQLHNHIVNCYSHKNLNFFGYGMPDNEVEDLGLTEEEYDQKLYALKKYDHENNIDGEPKWSALIKRYNLDLMKETHVFGG